MVIRLIVDFPNFIPAPLPTVPDNIAVSNPYHLFKDPAGPPKVIADCLSFPTSMSLNPETDTFYVSENGGSIVTIPIH